MAVGDEIGLEDPCKGLVEGILKEPGGTDGQRFCNDFDDQLQLPDQGLGEFSLNEPSA